MNDVMEHRKYRLKIAQDHKHEPRIIEFSSGGPDAAFRLASQLCVGRSAELFEENRKLANLHLNEPLIRKLERFVPLSNEDKSTLRELCAEDVRTIAAHRHIIGEGKRPEHVHLVVEGWAARVQVTPDGSREIIGFLVPGDICQLHATVLSGMDHGIEALTACKVAYLNSDKLDRITAERPGLAKALWCMSLVDEAITRQWVVNGRRRARAAIAHLLCELHVRMKLVGLASEARLNLPLTQHDLADATGMTAVHLNRSLKILRESGLIELRAKRLLILDWQGLTKIAGFDDGYLHLGRNLRIPA